MDAIRLLAELVGSIEALDPIDLDSMPEGLTEEQQRYYKALEDAKYYIKLVNSPNDDLAG